MSSTLGLILAASVTWAPSGDAARDLGPVVAAVLEMAEIDIAVPAPAPQPAQEPTPCDLAALRDPFAPQLAAVPSVEPESLITYSTDLPIFRDKA